MTPPPGPWRVLGWNDCYNDKNFNFTINQMIWKNMTSWADYWKTFDLLIEKLQRDGHEQIVHELKDAQRSVNGLTDGWFEFKIRVEKTLKSHQTKMSADQFDLLKDLIEALADSLARRG